MLIFWVLGFLVKDIKAIKGPQYAAFEKIYADKTLNDKKQQLEKNIRGLEREIKKFKDIQSRTEKNTENLQATMNQLGSGPINFKDSLVV